ncbi:hypothetical protein BN1013_00935 [Candidatus Rubidus massiliensis]|nr:hypothetical protein BN1013_00935 [Candidatus Rubidus massiliensis]
MINISDEIRMAQRDKPNLTPLMFQSWRDMLFLHWVFPEAEIKKFIPPNLSVDLYNGQAFVGLIPFNVADLKPNFLGNIFPSISFSELNMRTYVFDERGVPGIWFFSLDASDWLSVQAAKIGYHLPYYHSKFQICTDFSTDEVIYNCQRETLRPTSFTYSVKERIGEAKKGTLEFFLLERYVLFTSYKDKCYEARVSHKPYIMHTVDLKSYDDNVFGWNNVNKPNDKPHHIIFSKGVDAEIYKLTEIKKI